MRSLLGSAFLAALFLVAIGCGQKSPPDSSPTGPSSGAKEDDRSPISRLREREEADPKEPGGKPVAAEAQAGEKKTKTGAAPAKAEKPAARGYIGVTERAATVNVPTRGKDGKAIDKPQISFAVIVERTFDTTTRYHVRVGAYSPNDYLSAEQARDFIAFIDKLNTVKQVAAADPIKEVTFSVNWGSHRFYKGAGEWRHWFYGDFYCRADDIKKALQDALTTLEKLKATKKSVEW